MPFECLCISKVLKDTLFVNFHTCGLTRFGSLLSRSMSISLVELESLSDMLSVSLVSAVARPRTRRRTNIWTDIPGQLPDSWNSWEMMDSLFMSQIDCYS